MAQESKIVKAEGTRVSPIRHQSMFLLLQPHGIALRSVASQVLGPMENTHRQTQNSYVIRMD